MTRMNSLNAIEVEALGKRYYIASTEKRADTAVGQLARDAVSPLKRLGSLLRRGNPFAADEVLWALRDISFEVQRGEVFGIVGANGSGKSTLLKVLSRITYPTEGRARIAGRVGSLLEVGTGFHPELTGRENVYLNGAILGMKRQDISQLFDEIVDFAGVGQFIDTPVKRYSSGMRVRLAFAVASHFRPEILLVDEVLSVGDADFQRRGIDKMGEVARGGRTVLLVSHNMAAILARSDRVMWLNKGRLMMVGDPQEVVNAYLSSSTAESGTICTMERLYENVPDADSPFKLLKLRTLDAAGQPAAQYLSSAPLTVELTCRFDAPMPNLKIGFELRNQDNVPLFRSFYNDTQATVLNDADAPFDGPQTLCFRTEIPGGWLNGGTYTVNPLVHLYLREKLVAELRGLTVEIILDIPNREYAVKGRGGLLAPMLDWQIDAQPAEVAQA